MKKGKRNKTLADIRNQRERELHSKYRWIKSRKARPLLRAILSYERPKGLIGLVTVPQPSYIPDPYYECPARLAFLDECITEK